MIKPGDLLTYTGLFGERTGVVLDRAPGIAAYWVHREDGTFDMVRLVTHGRRKDHSEWLGQYTASGQPVDCPVASLTA